MAWALDVAKREKRVKVRSGGYSTSPVYDKNRIRRWRASQQLWIESADFEAVTQLLGELQSRLQLQSLDFSVSPQERRKVEDALIEEALGRLRGPRRSGAQKTRRFRLRDRADRHRHAGRTGAAPTHAAQPRRWPNPSVAPPAVEGGTSRVGVHINATIELD